MSTHLKFPRRTLWRALLAPLVSVFVLAIAVPAANARLILTPSTQGAGTITPVAGSFFGFNSCDNTGNQNDDAVAGCPGTDIAGFLFDLPVQLQPTPASTPAGHWIFVGWQGCPSVSGSVCVVNNPLFGNLAFSSPRAVFRDVAAPTITSITPVRSTSTDRGASFSVGANETLRSVTCSVDGGPEAACSTIRQFSEGNHTVRARGQDLSSNTAGALSAVTANFRIIDTQLVSGPADFSSVKRPTFTYSSAAGLDFRCSIDSGTINVPCGPKNLTNNRASFTPPADLPDGVHTFRAQAFDGSDADAVPIVRTWRVDTTAPVITGLASPTITDGVVTTALTAAFTWGVTEVGGLDRFECQLDSGGFEPCVSGKSFSDLPFGGRIFTVRGRDKAGNVGPSVSRSWTVAARDEDGDGFNQRSDCNDGDPRINPIAPDVPDNGVDENCDGADAVNLDRDADGFQRPADCDDANPNIRPGVVDILDNNIDENCDGSDAKSPPPTRIVVSMPFFVQKSTNKFTKFTQLQVKGIPQGSRLKVVCKAPKKKKCPAGNTFTKSNAGGTVNLSKWLKKKLLAGTTLTVTVTKPGNFIGAVKTMTIKKKARPSFVDRCAAPGTTKAIRC